MVFVFEHISLYCTKCDKQFPGNNQTKLSTTVQQYLTWFVIFYLGKILTYYPIIKVYTHNTIKAI